MDWSNESYVRLYTKDTPTWRRLKWQGQAVLSLLLRKIDQSGVMDGIEDVYDDVSIATGLPIETAREGLDLLIKYEVFAFSDSVLFMPNFLEAQTASKSDKQRQRESRDNRRIKANSDTKRDSASQNVTKSHTSSQPVTCCHSLLCLALPCNTITLQYYAIKKKREKPKKPSEKAQALSRYLFNKMLENNPVAKEPNFDSWGKHIDLLLNRDNRTPEQIKFIIDFSQQDDFWKQNILSTAKLRKQFDALIVKSKSKPKKKYQTQTEKNDEFFAKMNKQFEQEEKDAQNNNAGDAIVLKRV